VTRVTTIIKVKETYLAMCTYDHKSYYNHKQLLGLFDFSKVFIRITIDQDIRVRVSNLKLESHGDTFVLRPHSHVLVCM
jgi:hypothetical protein